VGIVLFPCSLEAIVTPDNLEPAATWYFTIMVYGFRPAGRENIPKLLEIDMRTIARHRHKRYAGIFQLAQTRANRRRQRGMIDWPINVKRRRQRVDQHWREIDIVARRTGAGTRRRAYRRMAQSIAGLCRRGCRLVSFPSCSR
jgi:hypothetical protein